MNSSLSDRAATEDIHFTDAEDRESLEVIFASPAIERRAGHRPHRSPWVMLIAQHWLSTGRL